MARREHPAFIDTPLGIVTASGTRFSTDVALLREYAGEVLDRVSIEKLIAWTEGWLRSGQTLALLALPVLLLTWNTGGAVAAAVILFIGWDTVGPSFVNLPLARVFWLLEKPALQGLYYVLTLSWLAATGATGAVMVGLAVFLVFRLRLADFLARPLISLLRRPLYPLPAPDHILRALIVRVALRHRLPLPQIDAIEKRMMEQLGRRKK
jgi:hypothetical protein